MATSVKLIATTIENNRQGNLQLVRLYEYNGYKFRFNFQNTDSIPMGFDHYHCIKVFDKNSVEWKYLADVSEIRKFMKRGMDGSPYAGNLENAGAYDFMEACKEYIKLIF